MTWKALGKRVGTFVLNTAAAAIVAAVGGKLRPK